jgi:hypothetical protein
MKSGRLNKILAVLMVAASLVTTPALSEGRVVTGNDLLRWCASSDPADYSLLLGYTMGVIEEAGVMALAVHGQTQWTISTGTHGEVVRQICADLPYIAAKKDLGLALPAALLINAVLFDHFPRTPAN